MPPIHTTLVHKSKFLKITSLLTNTSARQTEICADIVNPI